MARQLDKIIVIDIESTCWEQKSPPQGQESEIIEIGVCVWNVETCEREANEAILIRPERSSVSAFCTQLTTLTQDEVDQGISFSEACRYLRKIYLSRERTWASYGDYDRRQFERQCRDRNIGYPFGPTHINVKNLFALRHQKTREVGMEQACKALQLPLEGTHHRGVDDAWNIAAILGKLL